ncbi:MAG: glycosyltransferase family 2 protein [Flavobacteriales bacterium]
MKTIKSSFPISNFQLPTSSSKLPLVSIITVVYNGEMFIEQTIKSVLNQTYSKIEYIIVDGASSDGTLDIVKKYQSQIARLISEKDAGIYNAMNKGLALATGEIIAILNADDYYYPETIQQVVSHFNETNTDVVYGDLTKLRTINGTEFYKDIKPDISLMEKTMPIFHPSTFIKKHVYDAVGGFNEVYKLSSDYDFIYRVYKAGFKFSYLPKTLAVFRIGGASNLSCKSYEEGFAILKSHNSPYSADMEKLITKCRIKKLIGNLFESMISIFGLSKWNEKRLMKKWNG